MTLPGTNVSFTDDERHALLWAARKGHAALDDGFAFPRDQNRAILESAMRKLEGTPLVRQS